MIDGRRAQAARLADGGREIPSFVAIRFDVVRLNVHHVATFNTGLGMACGPRGY
jgi:hypothetical protein